jgi:hypothetical protein
VRSDGEENRFTASDDQGMFVMSRQGMVHGADGPTISIENDATGLGGDDGLVSEGIGEVGNGG